MSTDVRVRPYSESDEGRVLEVLRAALGEGPTGDRSARFFRWKHIDNPFGRSFLLVAEVDDRIVGLRAFMRWRFETPSSIIEAVRAVDTATHPAYQRMGIFSKLTRAALESINGQADLIFNTPNANSLPGYLKMGWKIVAKVPVAVRIRKPVALVRGLRGGSLPPAIAVAGDAAWELLRSDSAIDPLLEEASSATDRLATAKDRAFLSWRYGRASTLDYRALVLSGNGTAAGLAVFRVRRRGSWWETAIAELITRPGDRSARRRLLNAVIAAAPAHYITLLEPAGGSRVPHSGFVRIPSPMTLVVNPLHEGIRPDPTAATSWALTLGDLEVF